MIFNEEVTTTTGVPQGAVTSPLLFNIYINELLVKLNDEGVETLAFADDIAFAASGDDVLHKAIGIVKQWSSDFGIEINYCKSAAMIIRPDRRSKWKITQVHNIPIVETYKYLGVLLDDTGSFKPLRKEFE